MKRKFSWFKMILVLIPVLLLGSCVLMPLDALGGESRDGVKHYQRTWNVIDDWNRHAIKGHQRDDLLGYGEYLYNSYMALIPRETPSTLADYHFIWNRAIDVDFWGVYFTCQLPEERYAAFAQGLADFTVTANGRTLSLLHDTEHFAYPAYIVQWLAPDEKWEVLEYVLLDDENRTAIFVYTMSSLKELQAKADYNITPTTMEIVPEEQFRTDYVGLMGQSGFTIYENFDKAQYDLALLDCLK